MSTAPGLSGGGADAPPKMGDKRKLYVMEQQMEQQQVSSGIPLPKKQLSKADSGAASADVTDQVGEERAAAATPPPGPRASPTPQVAATHQQTLDATVLKKQNQMLSMKLAQLKGEKEHIEAALAECERERDSASAALAAVDGHWRATHDQTALLWSTVEGDAQALQALPAAAGAGGGPLRALAEAAASPWLEVAVPATDAAGDASGAGGGEAAAGSSPAVDVAQLDAALVERAAQHQALFEQVARKMVALAEKAAVGAPASADAGPSAWAPALTSEVATQRAGLVVALSQARARAASLAEQVASAQALADRAQREAKAAQRERSKLELRVESLTVKLADTESALAQAGTGGNGAGTASDAGAAGAANGAVNGRELGADAQSVVDEAKADAEAQRARADAWAEETFGLRRQLQAAQQAAERAAAEARTPTAAVVRASAEYVALAAEAEALGAAHRALVARAERDVSEARAEVEVAIQARAALAKSLEAARKEVR
mmetsp:Transcript_12771/g.38533  ORF Transcript_12771/g.38533 Transcript_12771/m.38533 type:complete len:494 (+) Transcript_12771:34-1515(+)